MKKLIIKTDYQRKMEYAGEVYKKWKTMKDMIGEIKTTKELIDNLKKWIKKHPIERKYEWKIMKIGDFEMWY